MTSEIGRRILTNLETGLNKTPFVVFGAMGMALMYHTPKGQIIPKYGASDVANSVTYGILATVLAQSLSQGIKNIKDFYYPLKQTPFDKIKSFGKKHFATACLVSGAASIAGIAYGHYKDVKKKETNRKNNTEKSV